MAYINLGQVVWPVGAIYMSSSSTSPASLFGGTWKKIDDNRFWLPSNNSLAYAENLRISSLLLKCPVTLISIVKVRLMNLRLPPIGYQVIRFKEDVP